ncbi:hypothetical protein GGX14DRAFT_400532 [Mycena pura]|uniref:Uncharacterized protein n=1 Tax=Mycena pura TaxID=153505 RepID=A0AAD6Y5M1_9AGAR|nr:hypothetical protein GGX14DRAFT_400532 [Mycena pura]
MRYYRPQLQVELSFPVPSQQEATSNFDLAVPQKALVTGWPYLGSLDDQNYGGTALHLPIKTFSLVRDQLRLANREEWRLIREKSEAANRGLETGGDQYSVLCTPSQPLRVSC